MKPRLIRSLPCATAAAILLLVTGCGTTAPSSSSATAATAAGQQHPSIDVLRIGMVQSHVRDWMGEPDSIESVTEDNQIRETWSYTRQLATSYKTVAAEMEEVPYVDPFTGQMRSTYEPRTTQQRQTAREHIRLIFVEGRLVDIRRRTDRASQFDP